MKTDKETFCENFEAVTESGCWIWTSYLMPNGYGQAGFEGKTQLAHRISYQLFKGQIPDGQCVLHRCDVRACVNPNHLFLGTRTDNAADRDAKGRQATGDRHRSRVAPESIQRGETHYKTKLTNALVREIRASGLSQPQIMRKYGLKRVHVNKIVLRKIWKHLEQ
jgi:hypothetical protein